MKNGKREKAKDPDKAKDLKSLLDNRKERRGRHSSKLTKETRDVLIECIQKGLSYKASANIAGISDVTFYAYRKLAGEIEEKLERKEIEERELTEREAFCLDLIRSVARAEAVGEGELLEMIKAAIPKDWRAAAWILEHRDPKNWGSHRLKVVENKHDVQVDHRFSVEDLSRIAKQVKAPDPKPVTDVIDVTPNE